MHSSTHLYKCHSMLNCPVFQSPDRFEQPSIAKHADKWANTQVSPTTTNNISVVMVGLLLGHTNPCRHAYTHIHTYTQKSVFWVCRWSWPGDSAVYWTLQQFRGSSLLFFVSLFTVSRSGGWSGGWGCSQKPILVNVGQGVQGSFLLHQPLLHAIIICYWLFTIVHISLWSSCKSGWQVWGSKPRWSEDRKLTHKKERVLIRWGINVAWRQNLNRQRGHFCFHFIIKIFMNDDDWLLIGSGRCVHSSSVMEERGGEVI